MSETKIIANKQEFYEKNTIKSKQKIKEDISRIYSKERASSIIQISSKKDKKSITSNIIKPSSNYSILFDMKKNENNKLNLKEGD